MNWGRTSKSPRCKLCFYKSCPFLLKLPCCSQFPLAGSNQGKSSFWVFSVNSWTMRLEALRMWDWKLPFPNILLWWNQEAFASLEHIVTFSILTNGFSQWCCGLKDHCYNTLYKCHHYQTRGKRWTGRESWRGTFYTILSLFIWS